MTMADNHNIKVLIIDDDPDIRRSILSYLEDMGFALLQASGGKEGIELFNRHKPDLVFTDLMMPEVDGLTVLETICRTSPETPVVVISGNGSVEYAIQAMRKGAWDYITKPIHDFAQLEKIADQVLDRALSQKSEKAYQESLQNAVLSQTKQLETAVSTDSITGLPTRERLKEIYSQFLIRENFDGNLFLMLIEVNNVKEVTKTFGHDSGKQMLQEVANRLKMLQEPQLVVGKLDGNEFVILVLNQTNISSILNKIKQTVFALPISILDVDVYPAYNIGIASFPQDGESIETLLQHADIACANARLSEKNSCCYYSQELWQQVQDRIALESGLRKALSRNEFELHYQPKIASNSKKMVGMEVLIRWRPQGGDTLIPPVAFIPILEETGMIIEVGKWVLESSCQQYMLWKKRGMGKIRLSVNVSAVQFHKGALQETVVNVLKQSGMPPEMLCLELTESIVVKDIAKTVGTLNNLSALGIKLSIDDFGTGYSSLNYLKEMPINELKIDRSFITNLPEDVPSIAIVDSVLSMARGLNMTVVAEGVETAEQAEFLTQRGCHELQGYLYSKPLPQQDFFGWCKDKEHCAAHHEQKLVCTWHETAPVSQLAGNIAHDFKNLMTGVIGNLSIAKNHLDETHQSTQAILRAEKASKRATELAQSLMEVARPGTAKKARCAVKKIIDECLTFSLNSCKNNIEVSLEAEAVEVAISEGELCQIMNNIILNALQAMPGNGTLNMKVETVIIPLANDFAAEPGKYIQFELRDNGQGMTPEVLAKVFDPYFTTKGRGNGLGLASVKNLVQKNGGAIKISSEEKIGTTVTILLPA